jgi:hypothetical protein
VSHPHPPAPVIFDTRDQVVHYPSLRNQYREAFQMEGIEQFVAYLNAKAGAERFIIVPATPVLATGRSGLTRHYATFIKGEPQLRLRAAIKNTHDDRFTLTRRQGAWMIPNLTQIIQAIAEQASVSFNDARQGVWDFLKAQLGDVMDRVIFPPVNAVTDDSDPDDLPDPLA